ncbi:N-acetyltransferase [Alistipes sp.]
MLEDVRRQELRIVPQCPFVAAYIRRHPEWEPLLADKRE